MILSDTTILKELNNGNIIITPFDKKYLNPNSVDLTLAPECKVYKKEYKYLSSFDKIPSEILKSGIRINSYHNGVSYEIPLDVKSDNPTEEFIIEGSGSILMPGNVYLYRVNERIGVKGNLRAKVEGKSSLGRLGLFVHVTAGFIDTGFEGSLVLELVATRPIRIYPNMKICQIEFARVEGEIGESYDKKQSSKYMNQSGVQASKMHENFK